MHSANTQWNFMPVEVPQKQVPVDLELELELCLECCSLSPVIAFNTATLIFLDTAAHECTTCDDCM